MDPREAHRRATDALDAGNAQGAVAPLWALLAAPLVAIAFGVLFGVLPARRAAALAPVQALARRG